MATTCRNGGIASSAARPIRAIGSVDATPRRSRWEFRRDAQFAVAQSAFLLRRPGEDQAREIVERLVPAPVESDEALLIEAVVRAGAAAQRVRATTVVGALLTIAALTIRSLLRRR